MGYHGKEVRTKWFERGMPYVVYVVTNAKGYVPMQLKFYPRYEIHLKIITEREISVTLLGEMQRDLLKDGLHTWAR